MVDPETTRFLSMDDHEVWAGLQRQARTATRLKTRYLKLLLVGFKDGLKVLPGFFELIISILKIRSFKLKA